MQVLYFHKLKPIMFEHALYIVADILKTQSWFILQIIEKIKPEN